MPKLEPIDGYSNLFRHPANGKIYLRKRFPGFGQVTRSTYQTSPRKAHEVARELERQILRLDPDYQPVTFEEVAKEYFEANEQNWREGTLEGARRIIHDRLIPEFGGLRMEKVDGPCWAQYTKRFYEAHPDQHLFNTRKYMVGIVNYAYGKGYIKRLPIATGARSARYKMFPISDPSSREGNFIPKNHFVRLVREARPKMRLFITIGYHMGMRPGEIMKMRLSDIDLEKRSLVIPPAHSKTRKGREIPLSRRVVPRLRRYIAGLPAGQQYVFQERYGKGPMKWARVTWNRIVRRASRRLPVDSSLRGYTPNDLRHSFITQKVVIEGKSTMLVAKHCGNSVDVIDRKYAKRKLKDLRSVVD